MWRTTTKPSADLTPVDLDPVTLEDGSTRQIFQTRFGKRFARVVEPNGFILWFVEETEGE